MFQKYTKNHNRIQEEIKSGLISQNVDIWSKIKVKQSRYRPGVAQRVPES